MGEDEYGHWLEAEDTGVGMSKALLTGPLLDFGQSLELLRKSGHVSSGVSHRF